MAESKISQRKQRRRLIDLPLKSDPDPTPERLGFSVTVGLSGAERYMVIDNKMTRERIETLAKRDGLSVARFIDGLILEAIFIHERRVREHGEPLEPDPEVDAFMLAELVDVAPEDEIE